MSTLSDIKNILHDAELHDIPERESLDRQVERLAAVFAAIDDVRIVVHCKDCKYYCRETGECHLHYATAPAAFRHFTTEADYCSQGIRV